MLDGQTDKVSLVIQQEQMFSGNTKENEKKKREIMNNLKSRNLYI